MSNVRTWAKPVALATLLAGILGGCAVYVPPPGPGPGPGYYRGGYYAAPAPYYYRGYYGRPYFRGG